MKNRGLRKLCKIIWGLNIEPASTHAYHSYLNMHSTYLHNIPHTYYWLSYFERAYEKRSTRSLNASKLKVAILISVYKEKNDSIIKTLKSIAKQSYSKALIKVYLILEKHDKNAKNNLNAVK